MIGRTLARIVKHRVVETPAQRDRHIYELEEELELPHTVDEPTPETAADLMRMHKRVVVNALEFAATIPQAEVEPEQLPEFGGAAPAVFNAPALVQELAAIDREARGDRFLERHGVRP